MNHTNNRISIGKSNECIVVGGFSIHQSSKEHKRILSNPLHSKKEHLLRSAYTDDKVGICVSPPFVNNTLLALFEERSDLAFVEFRYAGYHGSRVPSRRYFGSDKTDEIDLIFVTVGLDSF